MVKIKFKKNRDCDKRRNPKYLPPKTASSKRTARQNGGICQFLEHHVDFSSYKGKTMFDLAKEEKDFFFLSPKKEASTGTTALVSFQLISRRACELATPGLGNICRFTQSSPKVLKLQWKDHCFVWHTQLSWLN